ncbi:MAG: hypothetical protein POELPBGB_01450 [Bacteroidia bacterium]|nr:hypothetical protein [Bacteroidia bacterium]
MEKITLSRKELYDLVWSEPILTIAKKNNISDSILRSICKKFDIPIPPPGYWMKVKFNKPLEIIKLTGNRETIINLEAEESNSPQVQINKIQKEIETSGLDLTVPETLNTNEKLILETKKFFSQKNYSGFVNTWENRLSIDVSSSQLSRSLRFLDTFIKLIKARGHKATNKRIIVFGEEFEFALREKRNRELIQGNYSWETAKYTLTGKLVLKIGPSYCAKEWIDGNIPIEKQLAKIIATIEYNAEKERQEKIEREKIRVEEKKQRNARKQVRLRKEKELDDFQLLLTTSKRWFKSKSLREYIDDVERKAVLNNVLSEELTSWISWARAKADWYDPTIESEDDLLKEVDRNKLEFLTKRDYWDFTD